MSSTQTVVLRTAEAAKMLGVSEATFFKVVKQPDFPRKIRLGAKSVGYLRQDLMDWLESRKDVA